MPPISPSPLAKVYQQIIKWAGRTPEAEQAIARVDQLPGLIDPSRYAPAALARAGLLKPGAQRGFSESLVSSKAPFGVTTMRPSEFLGRTPPLDSPRDAKILEQLAPSIQKDRLRDLPLLWMEQYPGRIEAGYEGRHRMKSLQSLYGDDPVLMSLVKGDRFNMVNSPYYKEPVREWAGEIDMSPLQLMKQQIQFGDRPIQLNPLWMSE